MQAQADLEKAQRNLDFCTIKSPVKGVIIDRRVNIGQTVVSSLNTPSLFLIAKHLDPNANLGGRERGRCRQNRSGRAGYIYVRRFSRQAIRGGVGKACSLNATMTQNVVMYTVEVNTENPDNVLLPYLTANVHFVEHEQNPTRLLVPNAALRWSPSSLAQISPDARSQESRPTRPPVIPTPAKEKQDGSRERQLAPFG